MVLTITQVVNHLLKIRDEKGDLEVRYFDDHASYTPVENIDIVTSRFSDKDIVLLHDGN